VKNILQRKNLTSLIPLLFLIGIVVLRLFDPDIIQRERLLVFDAYQTLQPRVYKSIPVKIIDIDNKSLEKFGQWPWSRNLVSELITKLANTGTSTIGFDFVFSEPDNSSLHSTLKSWKGILTDAEIAKLKAKLSKIPTNDEGMAQVIGQTQVVLGFSLITEQNTTQPVIKAGISIAGSVPDQTVLSSQGAVKNLNELEKTASGNGSFNITPELDSIIRRLPLLMRLNKTYYPSLVLELLRVAQGASTVIIKTQQVKENQPVVIESIKVGNIIIPTDNTGNLFLYYTPDASERTIPAWKVLENKLTKDELSGQIVIVGTSAAGLKDLRSTPLKPFTPGVEIHANALEQILSENYLYRPDWLTGLELIIMTIVGLLLIVFMTRFGSILGVIIPSTSVILFFACSWYAFYYYHWLIDPVYPAITVLMIYSVISLLNYLKSEDERKYIRGAFSHYLSPELVDKLVKNAEVLKLGGEMRNMTVIFCDVLNFTSISEQLDAGHLTKFMNQFLTPMSQIILNEKGTIDKYIGDCIMAFWNAPIEDKDHAKNGCNAALKMINELSSFNEFQKKLALQEKRPFIEVNIGVGINSGICCVGNMGSDMRFDYSVIGDNVNLSSRLEGQSRFYGINIILSEYTLASMVEKHQERDFAILELDLIRVRGKQQSVRIYTVLGGKEIADSDDFIKLAQTHRDMIGDYYAQNWQVALSLIECCLELDRFCLTKLYGVYKQRIESYMVSPPESNWNGVYIAASKR